MGTPGPGSSEAYESLRRSLETFGLTGHEARVLLGLLVMGSASVPQLARFAGVARPNVYRMLEGLRQRMLAWPQPGVAGLWTSPGREDVVQRLVDGEDARHRAMRATADLVRESLAAVSSEAPVLAAPYLRILPRGAQLGSLYRRLVREARDEILVLNRGPYGGHTDPYPEVLEQAPRLRIRALYEATELESALAPFRAGLEDYHKAGVDGRVVDAIPVRLAVIDRRHVLTALEGPGLTVPSQPTPIHVEHPGFAGAQAMIFEHLWERSRPYVDRASASTPRTSPRARSDGLAGAER